MNRKKILTRNRNIAYLSVLLTLFVTLTFFLMQGRYGDKLGEGIIQPENISLQENHNSLSKPKIIAAILPHHDLVEEINESFYQSIASEIINTNYDQILIVGPQHYPSNRHIIVSQNLPINSKKFFIDQPYIDSDHAHTAQIKSLAKNNIQNDHSQFNSPIPIYTILLDSRSNVSEIEDLEKTLFDLL